MCADCSVLPVSAKRKRQALELSRRDPVMGGYAWVTLATNDAYSLGALVLAHSLRQVGTKHDLACLVTPGVTATMREKLAAVFSLVQEVNVLDSKDEAHLALLSRPELGITFTKLHCWRLTQYEKCVFVDADALVVRNCDELFEREELSAAPDVGWPDCFNSGVFVFRPSQQTFASITAFAAAKGSFDGGDQGLLNMYFSDWASKDISKHLPFIYNMCSMATYSYLPAFKQFGEDVRIIHFIGITKPWLQYFDTLTGVVQSPAGVGHLQPLLQLWWNIFCERVHPQLSISMASSTLAPIWHAFASPSYVPPNPAISAHSDATNDDVYSRPPDFSEFKDPWEEYSPQNDSFPSNDSARSDKNDNCHPQHNQQPHHHQQHRNEQHWERATSHSGENHNQGHSARQHWHEQHQWSEQRHHHEQRHNERYNEQRQHSEHHHQPSDTRRNKADDHHTNQHQPVYEHHANERQSYSAEAKHEVHTQHCANDSSQASHQGANYQNYSQSGHVADNQHCNRCNEKSGEQSWKTIANQPTDTRRIDSYPLPPAPCTDLHNVATRSDPNVTEHLDDANAGLAGALAQLTLGEARSAEQVALEEHMRKQSWEQGHIDYMGRDSFDNIWKKICETLSVAPQKEQTPPQQDVPQAAAEPAETAAPVEADKPAGTEDSN